jgi:hypothetical protein
MTLVVFPGAAAGAPAVGGVGLAVMVLVLAVAGGIVMVKQGRSAAPAG